MLDYPFPVVDTSLIAAVAAFSVCFAVLWLLLRSPVGGRLVAVPTLERWHDQPTPTFGGVGIFAGFVAGLGLALATGAVEWSGELGGIVAGELGNRQRRTVARVTGAHEDLDRNSEPLESGENGCRTPERVVERCYDLPEPRKRPHLP